MKTLPVICLPVICLSAILLLSSCERNTPAPENGTSSMSAADPVTTSALDINVEFTRWLDAEIETYLDFHPLTRTRLGHRKDYDKLDDVSVEALDRELDWRRDSVARMKARFDRDALDDQGRTSWDLWETMLVREEAEKPFRFHRYIFGRRGPHSNLPNRLMNTHRVESVSDLDAYLARISQVDRYLGQYLDRAKTSAERGIRAPYFDYDISLAHSRRVIDGAPFNGGEPVALWGDINAKIDGLVAGNLISTSQADSYREQFRTAMLTHVEPAYRKLIEWLEQDRTQVSETATGVWALPDGEAYYTHQLFKMTTLPLTADEIHETGLAEVARIHQEMDVIRQTVNFEGSLQDFFVFMREDPRFYLPSTDEGREAYLAMARELLGEMEKALPAYFDLLPVTALEVRRVESFREQAGGAAHYSRGTPDGSRPGIFYAHLVDMSAQPKFRLENLAYHEGLPGHHMQIAIQQELVGLPRFRTHHGYTAYSEGWGLYSEYLAKDMGFYKDPYSDFGRLSGELWRAVRLVVDTGIHARRWTETQAIEYALANSPKASSAVTSEIRRYFNNPAQATAYKIGMNHILDLRAAAMNRLGEDFSYGQFHTAVLGGGSMPLPILTDRVERMLGIQASGNQPDG